MNNQRTDLDELECCANCNFFEPELYLWDGNAGTCCLNPPVFIETVCKHFLKEYQNIEQAADEAWRFPFVMEEKCCGQYQPASAEEVKRRENERNEAIEHKEKRRDELKKTNREEQPF